MHDYFSGIWGDLTQGQTNVVLENIVRVKGVTPYEKIDSIDSLGITPEDGIFFPKDEFFSTLKGQ